MKYVLMNISLFIFLFPNYSCGNSVPASSENDDCDHVKVGAWYFGGWSFPPDVNGNTFHISPTLVAKYSEREPVWGWREDAPGVMQAQIDDAADAGLSFWGFCWYENTLVSEPALMDNLNNALDMFLDAPNKNRLEFCLLSCHPVSPVNWEKLCDRTVAYFKEPNYLRIDGKPVIVFFNSDDIISGMGGIEGVQAAFSFYREKARQAGIGEILIGARTFARGSILGFQYKYPSCGFDFLTTYNNADDGRKNSGANDYANLIAGDKKTWIEISENTNLPFLPVMNVGYDMRPWAEDHPTIPASDYWYIGVTPEKIAEHLREAIRWVKTNNDKSLANMLMIYAWNENGEGAWLTPTKSEGNARLDAIRKIIDEENN